MFLSAAELADLTGLKLPACQRRWLIRNGYLFDADINGRPKVLRAYVEHRLGLNKRQPSAMIQPNYAVIRSNTHE